MTSFVQNKYSLKAALLMAVLAFSSLASAFMPSQRPPEGISIPGNVVLALSVEFPTGNQISYTSTGYTFATRYYGYFDNRKCYSYDTTNEVFKPVSKQVINTGACPSSSEWSGNLLNWLTMTNLDQFRSVMTGGTRDNFSTMAKRNPNPDNGDTTGRTVLIRSFGSQQGGLNNNPLKDLIVGTPGMPLTGTNKTVRSFGYGSKFVVSDSNNFVNLSAANQQASCLASTPSLAATSNCFNIRVEVCLAVPVGATIPDVDREANCKNQYSGVAKPEGLIQEYSRNMRFAALGYLNVNNYRDGAVLRSAMKSVGPNAAIAGGGVSANPVPEWDSATGTIYENPDAADASATDALIGRTDTKSGLINYLNKFGYSGSYETYDNVSELFYAAQLYLRGRAPPASYSSSLTTAITDNFPVITGNNLLRGGTRDPIINSCQKNFILGIGDINTHCDGNLPGSTNTKCSADIPADPDNLNVQSLWDITRGLEGMADNGAFGVGSGSGVSGGNTPYIAGLAHWANTNDIRSDLVGNQNISTYWVDVLESPSAPGKKSQYWLATKYGGFRTDAVTGNNPNTNADSWNALKNGVRNGIPDTWFAGNDPISMRAGLSGAFADIASRSGANSASSAAVNSTRQTAGSQSLYASYNPKGWTGSVVSCSPTQSASQCASTPTWEASSWFKTTGPFPAYVTTPLLPSTRKVFTSSRTASFTTMPLQWTSLNSAQKSILAASDSQGQARLDYLRGDRTGEDNGLFRRRENSLLGDIVNSGITYVSGAGIAYSGPNFSGHTAYRALNKTRPPVIYVGANDGMLHAFSGADGKELFGYIPGSVFANLPALTALNFEHKFFVDSTPMVADIQKTTGAWGTVLVGGLGAGGKGYYALDLTNQSSFASSTEATLSSTLPLWEFTSAQDSDLGYTFNESAIDPVNNASTQIAKVADSTTATGAWRVIVGNGYGSTAGRAALFLLDANTGSSASKLMADSISSGNGLSTPRPVDTDRDGLIDTVYAGDLLGNMHKFQFSKLNPARTDYVVAKSGPADGGAWRYIGKVYASGEPITTAPSVAPACDGNGWNVFFGTGKLNEDTDYSDSVARSFYAVVDKGASSALTVGAGEIVNIPYTSSTVSATAVRTWTTPNLTNKRGWKMLFAGGERLLSNSTLPPDTGKVLFATTRPTGDVCTPGNTGFLMAVDICKGKIGEMVVDGSVLVGGVGLSSTGVIKVSSTYSNEKGEKILCNQDDCKGPNSPFFVRGVAPKGRYSWREILTRSLP
ncbi:PilC/PilY family type IV pilus protein [Polaromonas sp.]|uniref:pilus assembly protein n=1 Tax=Polaromonas sp. TaxID=1869339 RepID=UPI0013B7EFFE|nr:PilC/PilY family type IV pilus protein [Polaromonas sp.]NDP64266.1 hypothetical protein [Polaromonas sp.]